MKTMLRHFLRLLVHAFYTMMPRRVRNAIAAQVHYLDALSAAKQFYQTYGDQFFEGSVIESLEKIPDNETELIPKLVESFNSARQRQLTMSDVYKPSNEWKRLLKTEWGKYYDSLSNRDLAVVAPFLRNFFRNEGVSGFWGGTKMFEAFRNLDGIDARHREMLMLKHFMVWQAAFPNTSLSELDAPRIGNPWGYNFAGKVMYEPVFEYHFQAEYFRRLLSEIKSPVVLEIGGGFGGLAFHLLRGGGPLKYIGVDLPENILIQTYYLACAFPGARILTYTKEFSCLDRATINNYDIILLPNFTLPDIDSSIADLIINIRSLSEMQFETIKEYMHQIDRIGRLFFFHENIFAPRRDGLFGIPSTTFPSLANFRSIASAESRWPKYQKDSGYPCQENLYIHRDVISNPMTGSVSDGSN